MPTLTNYEIRIRPTKNKYHPWHNQENKAEKKKK